jgi:DNA repair exonuclease SbcCD nuclease subunit
MSFKLLHTSDWHGDKSLLGVSRFDEIERAVEQTLRAAIDEKVSAYCFTGDLCDPDDGALVLRNVGLAMSVARELSDYGIASLWLAGNHDVVEDGSGITTLSPIGHVSPLVTVMQVPGFYVIGGDLRVLALPYVARAQAYDPKVVIGDLQLVVPDVVLTHLMLSGAQVGDETTEMARGRDIDFPWEAIDPSWTVLAGHYHRRQAVVGPGDRVAYVVGSLARMAFGEERNDPGYQIVTVKA